MFFQQFPVTGIIGFSIPFASYASAGDTLKVIDFHSPGISKVADYRFGKRMFRQFLQAVKNVFCVRRLRSLYPITDHRLSFGHCSGFVQHHRINLFGDFQTFGVFYQDASFRTFTDAYHNGGRGGKSQCAWAGNDEYRNQCQQSMRKSVLSVQQYPSYE